MQVSLYLSQIIIFLPISLCSDCLVSLKYWGWLVKLSTVMPIFEVDKSFKLAYFSCDLTQIDDRQSLSLTDYDFALIAEGKRSLHCLSSNIFCFNRLCLAA
jgi:hypothetical protein